MKSPRRKSASLGQAATARLLRQPYFVNTRTPNTDSPSRLTLSVLVPAFNEAETIAEVLRQVLAIDLSQEGFALEVIVCDDGSTDDTYGRARECAARDARILVVRHSRNRGKGAAVRTALRYATGEFVLVQDADCEYDTRDYRALVEPLRNGAPVVYGSRFLRRRYPTGMALPNFLCNRVLTGVVNLLYRLRITDEATCYKLFRTDLLRSLELRSNGFEFCPEVTAKLGLLRIPIAEVPIQYTGRTEDEGKKIRWTDGIRALWTLFAHRFGFAHRRPLAQLEDTG